jgi:uncharacterized protein YycO
LIEGLGEPYNYNWFNSLYIFCIYFK